MQPPPRHSGPTAATQSAQEQQLPLLNALATPSPPFGPRWRSRRIPVEAAKRSGRAPQAITGKAPRRGKLSLAEDATLGSAPLPKAARVQPRFSDVPRASPSLQIYVLENMHVFFGFATPVTRPRGGARTVPNARTTSVFRVRQIQIPSPALEHGHPPPPRHSGPTAATQSALKPW